MTATDMDVRSRWRMPAGILAFGTFAVGTDAFVISGVLPDVARSLGVTIGAAGQLVTVFAIAYAVAAPVLAAATAHWDRRRVLVAALAVVALGNVLTALAPGYGLVLAARIVAGAGAAMYTSSASATAAALAGERERGKAIAIVMLGLTSALVFGAPLGTAIGTGLGWRATIWFVALLAAVAAIVISLRLPSVTHGSKVGLRQRLAPLADRRVLAVLASTVLVFTGIYIPFTYLSVVYGPAVDGDGGRVAILLLVFGVTATIGNLVAGRLTQHVESRRLLIVVTLALALVFLLAPAVRGSFATAVPVVAISGLLSFGVTTPQQHRLIALVPAAQTPLVTSLYQSAGYAAVFASGGLGGAGLSVAWLGAARLPWLAAGFVLAGTAVIAGRVGTRGRGVTTTPSVGD